MDRDERLISEAYENMNQPPKLVKYPSHSVDAFLVTTEQGLTLIKTMCHKYGETGISNAYNFPDEEKLMQTPEYRAWLQEDQKLVATLKTLFQGEVDWPEQVGFNPEQIEFMDFPEEAHHQIHYGVELGQEELSNWQIGAIKAILDDYGVEVRQIPYGTENEDHKCWLSFVQD